MVDALPCISALRSCVHAAALLLTTPGFWNAASGMLQALHDVIHALLAVGGLSKLWLHLTAYAWWTVYLLISIRLTKCDCGITAG